MSARVKWVQCRFSRPTGARALETPQCLFTEPEVVPHFVQQGGADLAAHLGNGIEVGLDFVEKLARPWIANPILQSLVWDGLWKGAGSVVVFLPSILLLFLFMRLMEDSGYLARTAVISDRVMAKIGLNGKSFIPLRQVMHVQSPRLWRLGLSVAQGIA